MIEVNKEKITKEHVDAWFANWKQQQEAIHEAHSKRDASVKVLMEQAITLYEQFIKESSDESVVRTDETYEVLPINGMERLQFVKTRPGQYACYRQLDELFIETKKKCARLRLKK
ncbi:YpoC family protein [Kurthia senegalensis]|uniref:YpoC family protein n=1 Tax=Kurthia senegalensis TaxID=1033740 RepID=UPI00028907CE|nr:hypothetical protein [Kurthia senegalensis]